MIKPILTEKTTGEAKKGLYTFLVERGMSKSQIRSVIESIYGVHVTRVRTMRIRGGKRKNSRGVIVRIASAKKAVVALQKDEKIDIFEEKKPR